MGGLWVAFKSLTIGKQLAVGLGGLFALSSAAAIASPPPAAPAQPQSKIEVKSEAKKEPIAFTDQELEDSSIAKGETKVKQEGTNGEKTIAYQVTYTDGKETDRKVVSETVSAEPKPKITLKGTYVAPIPTPSLTPSSPVYYANCSAARAAGAAPVYAGDPGYRSALDRDNDGVGCE